MANIDLLKKNKNIDEFVSLFIRSLPAGFIYNDNLSSLVKGFLGVYQDFLIYLNRATKDQFELTSDSLYLEELKKEYGLPNPIFPELTSPDSIVFAVSMMKYSKYLNSKEDFENFMLLLGVNVKFYHLNCTLLENSSFDYSFPATFSYGVSSKDKFTYLIYVEENGEAEDNFYNIGDAFDLDFIISPNNMQNAKKILDYLKPDYLIFEYITLATKNLYGL